MSSKPESKRHDLGCDNILFSFAVKGTDTNMRKLHVVNAK